MTPLENHARSIFLTALERSGQDADVYVEAACASDAELRNRVDELLQAHRQISQNEQASGLGGSPSDSSEMTEGPGTSIGPYRLLEQIGEGGFGIVYMAEQMRPIRRKVALKIIKPGMDTRLVVARFEAERQALALMDHPNIAQVFDGGATAAGRPYFVMELVRGIPITEFCDQGRLSVRERMELFVTVCRAVQHAHQKGIIHRDLKPSNVMVTMHDDKQIVKVIDFGIAKAVGQQLTEKTLFTNFAQMLGTPLYMSPEQAQMSGLDVDTRSDIYALGVLLYELLTGTTPFDRERLRTVAYDEIRRIIREEEPPKPSTRLSSGDAATTAASTNRGMDPRRLRHVIRGELDWIVMKCLEKDRNRRYETANGLAMDLCRYLNNEQVQACPPTLAYRLRKFTRRHRASIGMAGLLLAIATVGCAMTVWQALRAASARAAAVRAELALSATRQVAAEERANAIARDLETLSRANSLIESGRSHVDFSQWARAEADLTAAVRLRPDHSSAWLERGQLYGRLHLLDLAAADFQKACKLPDQGSVRSLYCHALLRLRMSDGAGFCAACDRMIKQFDRDTEPWGWEKEEIVGACLLAMEPILPPDRLVQLTQRAVDAGRSPARLASLGTAMYRAGLYEAGLNRLQESRAVEPGLVAWTDSVTAMIEHRLGQSERAHAALRSAALAIDHQYEKWCEQIGKSPDAQWWNEALGELYFREAARLIEGALPKEGPLEWTHRGDSLVALGRNSEARASYQRAIELSRAPQAALARRASLFVRVGDWKSAFEDYDQLVSQHPDDVSLSDELAWRLCTCPDARYRDYRRAAELARRAVALAAGDSKYWNTLALALYRVHDWPGSVKAVMKSMKLTNAGDGGSWLLLAMCQWRLDQKQRARQLFVHALRRISDRAEGPEYLAELCDEAKALLGQPETAPAGSVALAQDDLSAYKLLLEIEPGAQWVYTLRVEAGIRLKQWDQVAADSARRIDADPKNPHHWYTEAAARLGAGDFAGYRTVRTGMLARFRDTREPWIPSHLSYVCAALPAGPEEAEALLQFADVSDLCAPVNPRIRGAMNYRAGRFEAAIADLDRSALGFPRRAWDWLFLAMAHYKLGHGDEAKKALKKAEEWIDRAEQVQAGGPGNPWINWYEALEVDQLLKEARALIR